MYSLCTLSLISILVLLAQGQDVKIKSAAMYYVPEIPDSYSIVDELYPKPRNSIHDVKPRNERAEKVRETVFNVIQRKEGKPPSQSTVSPQPVQHQPQQQRIPVPSSTPAPTPATQNNPPPIQQPRPQPVQKPGVPGPAGDFEHIIEFEQFKNIEFKAAKQYKLNKISDEKVVDRLYKTKTAAISQQLQQIQPNKPKQQILIQQNKPVKPQNTDQLGQLQKNVKNVQKFLQDIKNKADSLDKLLKPLNPQTSTEPTTPVPPTQPKLRTDESVSPEQGITKTVFTAILIVAALVVLFAYKPEERKRGPYIPASDEEIDSLH